VAPGNGPDGLLWKLLRVGGTKADQWVPAAGEHGHDGALEGLWLRLAPRLSRPRFNCFMVGLQEQDPLTSLVSEDFRALVLLPRFQRPLGDAGAQR